MPSTLIIGAASGLGRLWADRLLGEQQTIVVADRDIQGLAPFAARGVQTLPCDVSRPEDVASLLDDHPHDRVVLTAAIMPTSLALDDDPARIRQIMEVNYFGAVAVLRAALPPMLARGRGDVVVFGSVAGEVPTPHMSAYSASKAALAMYIHTLQMELEGQPVSVRLVLPPITDTPLLQQARDTSNPRSFEVGREQGIVAKPEDVVDGARRGLRGRRGSIYPHRMARVLHLARRFIPGMLRAAILRSEQA